MILVIVWLVAFLLVEVSMVVLLMVVEVFVAFEA